MTTQTIDPTVTTEADTQPAPLMTEQEAMEILVGAAQELAWLKYRHFPPGTMIPPAFRDELRQHAKLLEAAKVARGLAWWQPDNGAA